jgi:hypothetical protein
LLEVYGEKRPLHIKGKLPLPTEEAIVAALLRRPREERYEKIAAFDPLLDLVRHHCEQSENQ